MREAEGGTPAAADASAPTDGEWRGRPVVSAGLRLAILCVPMLASVAISTLLTRLLPLPSGRAALVAWFVGISIAAAVVFFAFQRLLRRLLPLATLLSLTMIFPDRAPARFAVARRAGRVRDLEAAVARGETLGRSPGDAAATVLAFVTALTSHDKGTRGHSERTRVFTDMLAAELGLSKQEQGKLRWAALLHDIGKLHVPSALLNKPGRPDAGEWEIIKAHPAQGARMIAPLVAWLGPWAQAVDHHHEKYDGSGYPAGLAGRQISLAGRIVAVADAYETMTAPRPYKRAMSIAAARKELVRSSGTHFDPVVVRAFLNISVGRLRRAVGVAAWVGQLPAGLRLLEGTARLGGTTAQAATAAVATVGIVTGVVAGPHLHPLDASAAGPTARPVPAMSASPTPSSVPTAGHPSGASASPAAARPSASPTRSPAPPGSPAPGAITITMLPTASPPRVTPRPTPPPAPTGAAVNLAPAITMPATTTSDDGDGLDKVYGSFTDPDSSSWTATVDYGDGSGIQPLPLTGTSFTLDHPYAGAAEGASEVITVRVRDNQGAVAVRTAVNHVVDADPKPVLANATLGLTHLYAATASFQDPGADSRDTYSATVDYGDGSGVQPLLLTGMNFSLSHLYPLLAGATYRVTVTITDSGGGQGNGRAYITAA